MPASDPTPYLRTSLTVFKTEKSTGRWAGSSFSFSWTFSGSEALDIEDFILLYDQADVGVFDKYFTIDEVVFGEPGDQLLLGARTLEGFNASVDPKRKKLVASGPLTAA